MAEEIYIIGSGALGREVAASLGHPALQDKFIKRGFIDDMQPPAEVVNGIPIQGDLDWLMEQPTTNAIIAIANISVRVAIFKRLSGSNMFFPSIIHPGAGIHAPHFISIAPGCYIADGCILTTNIRIGQHSILLPGVLLSHDTVIGDFCTIMPGVRISNGAYIGDEVKIGTGVIIAKPTTIPDGTVIPPGTIIA